MVERLSFAIKKNGQSGRPFFIFTIFNVFFFFFYKLVTHNFFFELTLDEFFELDQINKL